MTIKRPNVEYNDAKHEYKLDGVKLDGVSTVAKIGDDNVWGAAAAWAFRIGYEGAFDIWPRDENPFVSKDELREALKQARKTPWHKTKESQERGTAIHDALEHLAQKGEVPILEQYPEEQRGYIQGLCRWFLDYRPEFVATEVQVVSEEHKFAGRYDARAWIGADILHRKKKITTAEFEERPGPWLTLDDLKTGKRVYPTSQFAQLAGYELASREMGYPATDAEFILNVHADGSYDFDRGCARMEEFLDYLAAHRAIKAIKERAK